MQPISAKIKDFNEATAQIQNIEVWNTRFGASVRDVKRTGKGRFIKNLSAKQLTKAF